MTTPPEGDDLGRFARDAAVDESAAERARGRGLRQASQADASLRGALTDLAERHAGVVVATRWGGNHPGALVALGDDIVTLVSPMGHLAVIRLDAIATVRTHLPSAPQTRVEPVAGRDMAAVLSDLSTEREWVQLRCGSAPPVVGSLVAAGLDVVSVEVEGTGTVLAAIEAVTEVVVSRRPA